MDLNNDAHHGSRKIKLPVILSTGLSSFNEIKHAVQIFRKTNNHQLILLHCKAVYPPSDKEIDLNNIDFKRGI